MTPTSAENRTAIAAGVRASADTQRNHAAFLEQVVENIVEDEPETPDEDTTALLAALHAGISALRRYAINLDHVALHLDPLAEGPAE